MGVHEENIRPVIRKVSDNTYKKQITITMANCSSVNNKIDEMLPMMYDEKIYICILTETWIKEPTTLEKLDQMGHKFLPVNGLDRPGGGIGLLYKNYLVIMELTQRTL